MTVSRPPPLPTACSPERWRPITQCSHKARRPAGGTDNVHAVGRRARLGYPDRHVVALAHEAGVPRNALTQRHTDLKAQFYARVQARGGTSEVETRLRQMITRLKVTIANKNTELDRLRADVPALVRTINVLTLETSNSARHTHRPTRRSYRSRLGTDPRSRKSLNQPTHAPTVENQALRDRATERNATVTTLPNRRRRE